MKYHQRDIVEVSFLFPDGTFKPHPAIIVSNDQLQEDEDGMFYLVLITSNDWINPQYSYPLTDDMIVGKTIYDGPIHPSADELDGGRFWIRQQILDAIGQNILTPNLESEYLRFFK